MAAMHHRSKNPPGSTNPFTGRGLPASSPYRVQSNNHGNSNSRPPLANLAKKAALLLLSFMVFFYIVSYSSGEEAVYIPPNSKNDSYKKDDRDGGRLDIGKKKKKTRSEGGEGFQKEPTKLVLPPGGDEGSRSAGVGSGRSGRFGGDRGLDSGLGLGGDQGGFGHDEFRGRDTHDGFGNHAGLNLGGDNSESRDNNRDAFRSKQHDSFDADKAFGAGGGDFGEQGGFGRGGHGGSESRRISPDLNANNWSANGEAPPSRSRDGGTDDGMVSRRRPDDNSQDAFLGLRGGNSRSSGGKVHSNVDLGFGQGGHPAGKSAALGDSNASGSVDVDSYRKRFDDPNDADKSDLGDSDRDSGLSTEKGIPKIHPFSPSRDLGDIKSKSRDNDPLYKHQDQLAIPRGRGSLDPSEDNSGPDFRSHNRFQTNVSGDVKKYLQNHLKSLNQNKDDSSDNRKAMDDSDKIKDSGDNVSYKKRHSDIKARDSGDVSHKDKYSKYSDAKLRDSGDVSHKKQYSGSGDGYPTYKKKNAGGDRAFAKDSDDAAKKGSGDYYKNKHGVGASSKDSDDAAAKKDSRGYYKKKYEARASAKNSDDAAAKKDSSDYYKKTYGIGESAKDSDDAAKKDSSDYYTKKHAKDSGDVEAKEYLKSNRDISDQKRIGDSGDYFKKKHGVKDSDDAAKEDSSYYKERYGVRESTKDGDDAARKDSSDYKKTYAKDSGDIKVKEYLKSNRDPSERKRMGDSGDYSKGKYGVGASAKDIDDAAKDSGDDKVKEYLKSNIDSSNRKASGDTSYKNKYSSTKKIYSDGGHASAKDDGEAAKDSGDVKVKEYLKSNRDSSDRKASGDVSYQKKYSGRKHHSDGAQASAMDSGDVAKDSGDAKVKEYLKEPTDSKRMADSDKSNVSGDVSYKKMHSSARKHNGDEGAKDSGDAAEDSGDVAKKYIKSANDSADRKPDDSDKMKLSEKYSTYKKNSDRVRTPVKDSDDAARLSGDVSGEGRYSAHKKNIDEVGASIKESDVTKDSSDVKKYADPDKASADLKRMDSDDNSEKKMDSSNRKNYPGKKHSSYMKDLDELGASIKKNDASKGSRDFNSDKAFGLNFGEKPKDSGDAVEATYKQKFDEVGASAKKSDATKASGDVKKDVNSDEGSTDQRPVDSEESKEDVSSADNKESTDETKQMGEVGESAKKSGATKDSSDAKKTPNSGDASSDQKQSEVVDESKKSNDARDVDSADQKSADKPRESAKKSDDSADEKQSNDTKVSEIKASNDLEEKGSKKASDDQKTAKEGDASKKSDATKKSSDVAEKAGSKDASANEKRSEGGEASVKKDSEEVEPEKKSGKLRRKKVEPVDEKSDADAEKASSDKVTTKEVRESDKESDGKKKTLLNRLGILRKKAEDASANTHRRLQVATWNIAAINNNPFEYWITYDDDKNYEKIMSDIETFLEEPSESNDVPVSEVFTEEMFSELEKRMDKVGWHNVRSYWDNDFKNRKIISQFIKDPLLGSKRLASMPDRITNTINVVDSDEPVFRPTVINQYEGDLSDLKLWWAAWEKFMFDTPLKIQKKDDLFVTASPYEMLQKIRRSKYPDITKEEEKVSLPLQTMCGAIFDAILVHMMNTVSEPGVWQPLKKVMVENLNKQKIPHTLEILEEAYSESDIITLQEVSASLINQAKKRALGEKFWIIVPDDMDAVRDQNSVILLCKKKFPEGSSKEITSLVESSFEEGVDVPIAKGDILAITAKDRDDTLYVIASFHGDTNGLATKPVVSAIMKAMSSESDLAESKLIFGLDANTYAKAKPGKQQDVLEFGEHYVSLGLTSAWGDVPNPSNYTTFNSRTYLQPQLNKACKKSDKRANGDVNPKDFILTRKSDFKVLKTFKDNTGEKKYIEDMAFPTLKFPSDHGILATIVESIDSESAKGKLDHDEGTSIKKKK